MGKVKYNQGKLFGDYLRKLRVEKGLTLLDVAKRLHQTPQYISMIETGKQMPSVETLAKIQKVFKDDELLNEYIGCIEQVIVHEFNDLY